MRTVDILSFIHSSGFSLHSGVSRGGFHHQSRAGSKRWQIPVLARRGALTDNVSCSLTAILRVSRQEWQNGRSHVARFGPVRAHLSVHVSHDIAGDSWETAAIGF
jgi:hypothetical protein